MPELTASLERICATCGHFDWKPGNPNGWRWAYCNLKKKWFQESIEKPGERKGCEEWN